MKLVCNRFEQHFDFEKNFAQFLVIENSSEYLKVIQELYAENFLGEESDFVLSENGEVLSISKNCLLLYNFFDLDLNNKKISTEINARIAKVFETQDFVEDFCKLNQLFVKINDGIIDNFDFKLEYDDELSYDKLIKLAGFKISQEAKFIEKLMSYVKIYSELKKVKLVIFVGLSNVLSLEEISVFLKELEYLNLKCLLIESHQKYNLDFASQITIDDDMCEI